MGKIATAAGPKRFRPSCTALHFFFWFFWRPSHAASPHGEGLLTIAGVNPYQRLIKPGRIGAYAGRPFSHSGDGHGGHGRRMCSATGRLPGLSARRRAPSRSRHRSCGLWHRRSLRTAATCRGLWAGAKPDIKPDTKPSAGSGSRSGVKPGSQSGSVSRSLSGCISAAGSADDACTPGRCTGRTRSCSRAGSRARGPGGSSKCNGRPPCGCHVRAASSR
jgi:hypothetical protein